MNTGDKYLIETFCIVNEDVSLVDSFKKHI